MSDLLDEMREQRYQLNQAVENAIKTYGWESVEFIAAHNRKEGYERAYEKVKQHLERNQ